MILPSNSFPSFPSDLEKRIEKIEAWINNVRDQLL